MTRELCPFHRVEDGCLNVARMLVDAGLLSPASDAPVLSSSGPSLPPVPSLEVTFAAIAQCINTWGRVAIDPSVPFVDAAAGDTRSLRYSLQALRETASARDLRLMTSLGQDFVWWSRMGRTLAEAETAAQRTTYKDDPEDLALQWYSAFLYLDRARSIWAAHQGRTMDRCDQGE